jgi:hypothetical protein
VRRVLRVLGGVLLVALGALAAFLGAREAGARWRAAGAARSAKDAEQAESDAVKDARAREAAKVAQVDARHVEARKKGALRWVNERFGRRP